MIHEDRNSYLSAMYAKNKDTVKLWLLRNGLKEYAPAFDEDGWDDMAVLTEIEDDQLKDIIKKGGHRAKFKKALEKFKSKDVATGRDSCGQLKLKEYSVKSKGDVQNLFVETFERKPVKSGITYKIANLNTNTPGTAKQQCLKSLLSDSGESDLEQGEVFENEVRAKTTITDRETALPRQQDSSIMSSDYRGETQPSLPCDDGRHKEDKIAANREHELCVLRPQKQVNFHRPEKVVVSLQQTVINESTSQADTYEYHQYLKEQMDTCIDALKKKDRNYVEPAAFGELKDIVEGCHWGVLLGKAGDGKSSMAAHLMFDYQQKGYEPVYVKSPSDWKQLVNGNRGKNKTVKQFVLIDDMFGHNNVNERIVEEWLVMLEMMALLVEERDGRLIVVCTNRRYVYYDVVSKLASHKMFRKSSVVDLTEKTYHYNLSEKTKIFETMKQRYGNKELFDTSALEKLETPYGFPGCVEAFFTHWFLRNDGMLFFQMPMKCIVSEIINLKENDRVKYCLLIFVLFRNNRLEKSYLKKSLRHFTDEDKVLFHNAGVSTELAYTDIQKNVNSLVNVFIEESPKGVYSFSHQTIMDSVAFIYMKDNLLHAIEELDFEYLITFIRYSGAESGLAERNTIILPDDCTEAFIKRVTKEIELGNIFAACRHQAWCDGKFISKWINHVYCNFCSADVADDHSKANAMAFHSAVITRISNSMFEPLIIMKRKIAVLSLLKNNQVLKTLKNSSSPEDVLSFALQVACSSPGNEDIVKTLLSKGANATSLDDHGRILLMLALEDVPDSAKILLDEQKLIPNHRDKDGRGYFHYLVNSRASQDMFREFCGILISVGEDINLEDKYVRSPLFECVDSNETCKGRSLESTLDRFAILMEKGADPNVRDNQGRNLVLYVLRHIGRNDVCLQFLQHLHTVGVDFLATDNTGKNAMHYMVLRTAHSANRYRNDANLNRLFSFLRDTAKVNVSGTSDKNIDPLMLALEYCSEYEFVHDLVKYAVKGRTDADGRGYFHYLVKSKAVEETFRHYCKILISIGENLNHKDNDGISALFLCNELLDTSLAIERMLVLFEYRADFHAREKLGKTLLLLTVETRAGTYSCIRFLKCMKSNGVDFNATDNEGKNVLHYFVFRTGLLGRFLDKTCCNETFDYLLKHAGVKVTSQDKKGRNPLMLALRDCLDFSFINELLRNTNPRQLDIDGKGYFHYLAKSDVSEQTFQTFCDILIQKGEEVNLKDTVGRTPVFECVAGRIQIHNCLSYLQVLSDCRADLNAKDKYGANLLMVVLKSIVGLNNLEYVLEVLEFLSSNGVRFEHKDKHGRNALYYLMLAEVRFNAIFNVKIMQTEFNDVSDFVKRKISDRHRKRKKVEKAPFCSTEDSQFKLK